MFSRRPSIPILALAVLVLVLAPIPASAESHQAEDPNLYTIDESHASVSFKVSHFTVSKVRGSFGDFSGQIHYDPADISDSGVKVKIAAASIDTGHEQRDNHLKSGDFLDLENHPTIVFKSTGVEKSGDGYTITGDLTIRGVTNEVSFPFSMVGPIKDPLGMQRIGIEGELTIDRRDWGLEWNKVMETGGVFVGHDVEIEIAAEATRE